MLARSGLPLVHEECRVVELAEVGRKEAAQQVVVGEQPDDAKVVVHDSNRRGMGGQQRLGGLEEAGVVAD